MYRSANWRETPYFEIFKDIFWGIFLDEKSAPPFHFEINLRSFNIGKPVATRVRIHFNISLFISRLLSKGHPVILIQSFLHFKVSF